MKGSYKVYNANKGEWVNLDHTAAYDNVRVKIENNHLWVSYDFGNDGSWEDKGEVVSSSALNDKVDKTYVDDNFAKKDDIPSNYIVNGENTGNVECIIVNEHDDHVASGLEIKDGEAKLCAAIGTGSVETAGGCIEANGEGITISSWNESLDSQYSNAVTLTESFKYNDREILHTDEDGNLNVKNLSIGSLVIDEDDQVSYQFIGDIPFAMGGEDVGYYHVTATLEEDVVEELGEIHVLIDFCLRLSVREPAGT